MTTPALIDLRSIQQEIDHFQPRLAALSRRNTFDARFCLRVLALVLPESACRRRNLILDHRFVPQLMLGLITLVVLVNMYLVSQPQIPELDARVADPRACDNQRLENLSLYDPHTNLFNRRAMDEFVSGEVTRV